MVTAIVVSGAGATAMCADLGARTIREEIDAMTVIGVNPIQALVVPRVVAATFVALMLYSVVAVVGLTGSYVFVVFVQHVTPGAFVAGMTLLTGLPQVIVSLVKALLFGLSAGLIACYKGLSVGGGPTAVGQRRQRDRGVLVHGAVPHQHPRHRLRREGGTVTPKHRDRRHRRDAAAEHSRLVGRHRASWASRPRSTAARWHPPPMPSAATRPRCCD